MKRLDPTSDVLRVRPLLLAGAVAAAAAVAALGAGPEPFAPGPLSPSHARASLACGSCHDGEGAARSCAHCHGEHRSARAGHQALAARGALGCTSCHSAHAAEGVTFTGERRFVVWGPGGRVEGRAELDGPPSTTVPFVPIAACTACHRLEDARDPIERCARGGVVTCYDEHALASTRSNRFVAWEAARAVAGVARPRRAAASLAPFGWTATALAAGGLAFVAFGRRSRPRTPDAAPPPAASARVRLPVIDPSTCLGCSACVDACAFDVLAIERFVAVVARPLACCGAVVCAEVCPNGSLRIAEGDVAPERPRVDAHLESLDAPGVFLAGDLTGLPLIRNAMRQGASVAERVAAARPKLEGALDLVVIGAGPAGVSALVRAKELGLRAACLEQGAFAESIRSFPRGKVVFDVPGADPLDGPLWMREATKEELIARWTHAVRARALDVREGRRVVDVKRAGSAFVVTSEASDGGCEDVRAASVLLAIGRRGTPRTLPMRIAAGAEGDVSYALADAQSFAGKRVLVVGLGDTAMEAAIALAHQPGTEVTVSYRGASMTRGRARNLAEMRALVDRGRVRLVLESTLEEVRRGDATLRVRGAPERVKCDAVLVLIGGTPSWTLLARAGVQITGREREA